MFENKVKLELRFILFSTTSDNKKVGHLISGLAKRYRDRTERIE